MAEKETSNKDKLVGSGIADTVLNKLKGNYGKKPDMEDCVFSVRQVEDIFSKKQVAQVVVEFQSPRNQEKRLTRAFAVGPTVLGETLFTPEQQNIMKNILQSQEKK
jgi:hypothetical protein